MFNQCFDLTPPTLLLTVLIKLKTKANISDADFFSCYILYLNNLQRQNYNLSSASVLQIGRTIFHKTKVKKKIT